MIVKSIDLKRGDWIKICQVTYRVIYADKEYVYYVSIGNHSGYASNKMPTKNGTNRVSRKSQQRIELIEKPVTNHL